MDAEIDCFSEGEDRDTGAKYVYSKGSVFDKIVADDTDYRIAISRAVYYPRG